MISRNHDRPMRAGGSLAAGDHLGDVAGITLRRVLFILFRKVSRILSSVPRPALGFFRTHDREDVFLMSWSSNVFTMRSRPQLRSYHIAEVRVAHDSIM